MTSYVSNVVSELYEADRLQVTASAGDRVTTTADTRRRITRLTEAEKVSKKRDGIDKRKTTNNSQSQANKQTSKPSAPYNRNTTNNRQGRFMTTRERKEKEERYQRAVEKREKVVRRERREREDEEKRKEDERRERRRDEDDTRERDRKRRKTNDDDSKKAFFAAHVSSVDVQMASAFAAVGGGFVEWLVQNKIQHGVDINDPIVSVLHRTVFPYGSRMSGLYEAMGIESTDVSYFVCV